MPGDLQAPDPSLRCKNCREKVVWGRTANGALFGWFHVESGLMPCYPDNPQAEPDAPQSQVSQPVVPE